MACAPTRRTKWDRVTNSTGEYHATVDWSSRWALAKSTRQKTFAISTWLATIILFDSNQVLSQPSQQQQLQCRGSRHFQNASSSVAEPNNESMVVDERMNEQLVECCCVISWSSLSYFSRWFRGSRLWSEEKFHIPDETYPDYWCSS